MTFLRKNEQGYDEYLWLKDSSVMVKIPAGSFTMGSERPGTDAQYGIEPSAYSCRAADNERPAHRVYLDDYFVDKYEVTNRQFRRFCDAAKRAHPVDALPYGKPDYLSGYPDCPAVGITWYDARAYATWAGKQLSTEAQWEKAARGTDGREFPWGDQTPGDSFYGPGEDPCPVGSLSKDASPYGCMDMAGNATEWCNDWYDSVYYHHSPDHNPLGPANGTSKVVRGIVWQMYGEAGFSSERTPRRPSATGSMDGFRCVLSVPPPSWQQGGPEAAPVLPDTIWLGTDLSDCGLIYCVVYDPSNTQIIYIATEKRGVMKSSDGGVTWFEVNTGMTDRCAYWLVMARNNPLVLYAGTQSKGAFKTTDGGQSWVAVNTGLPQLSRGVYPAVWCLAFAPTNDNLIYAGTGGGLFRSPDGGQNWYLVPGLPVGVVRCFGFGPGNANRIYTGYDWGGFYYSANGGTGWQMLLDTTKMHAMNRGWETAPTGLSYFVFDPTNPNIMYYIFGPGGIYKSINGGVNWDFLNSGFPTNIPGGGLFYLTWIAIDPSNPLVLYGAGNDGRVYISRDGGKSWGDYSYGLGNAVLGSIGSIGFDPQGRPWIGGKGRLVEQGKITERKTLSALVNFGFDSTDIKPIAYPVLDSVVATLKADPTLRAVIEGHTDSIGTDSYNQDLSQRRAKSVVSYLASKGIAASRLTATGYGVSMPIASNSTDEGRQKNRRVEILIVRRE
jgi:iron(II)-dependent oxidoreductase